MSRGGCPKRNRPGRQLCVRVVIEVERPPTLLVVSSAYCLPSNDPHGLHEDDASNAGSPVRFTRPVPSAFIT
jgi:hypothetical protein